MRVKTMLLLTVGAAVVGGVVYALTRRPQQLVQSAPTRPTNTAQAPKAQQTQAAPTTKGFDAFSKDGFVELVGSTIEDAKDIGTTIVGIFA